MNKFFGPMEQVGIVVEDFNDPINHWTNNLNVGPFVILEHLDLKDVYYDANDTNIDFSVALAYSGDLQIELIKQHCDTPSIYNDYVGNKKNNVHHFCTFSKEIETDIRNLESIGYKNIQGGKTQDGGSFAYLDKKDNYGAILEIAQLSEGGYAMFNLIKNAAKKWDGKTSIVTISEISL
tara:strand:+ start:180 stop:716 length:537 start_codon:yes stop_codon:yes gene_type:complete